MHYEKFNDGSIECIENEIPFALPKGWKWTRFGNIIKLMSGTSYPIEQEKREGKKLYVKVGDMNLPENSFEIVTSMQYLDDYSSSHLVPRNSVIFPKRGGAIATNKKKLVLREEIIVDLNTMAFTPISPVYLMYCYYWFLSIDISEINTGTSIPQINNKDITPLLFPLPPVKEQYRIASTIGTLLSRIDSINKNKAELSQLIEQTKTKILDLAIRGKLVPQDPNDEPASVLLESIRKEKDELIKAGKLKRDKRESVIFRGEDNSYYENINGNTVNIEAEIPFAIPDGWAWTRLGNIGQYKKGPFGSSITKAMFVPDSENAIK